MATIMPFLYCDFPLALKSFTVVIKHEGASIVLVQYAGGS